MSLVQQTNGSWTDASDPGEPQTGVPRVSVTDEEAVILAWLGRGRRVLEIGTGLGVSTRALASTAQMVVTVDVDPWVHDNVWPTLPHNVDTVTGCTHVGVFYDLVFIDGDHDPAAVERDVHQAERVCRSGLIVAHDTNYGHVRAALERCARWSYIDTVHGLGLHFRGLA